MYTLDQLKQITPPTPPQDFQAFWQPRYQQALSFHPKPQITHSGSFHQYFEIYDLIYHSLGNFTIGGWVLIPKQGVVKKGVVVGHGYGGIERPDFDLPIENAAFLFPCFRGLCRSKAWPISDNPAYHVLHDLDKKEHYILGYCVADLWLAISTLMLLFPACINHIGYLGISFGGGIGAIAMAFDQRIQRGHLNVPSFGHQALRLEIPSEGSATSVQNFVKQNPQLPVKETLAYYDAANAAFFINQPMHIAAALSDRVVTPVGQFAIYNALQSEKQLFVLEKGHSPYLNRKQEEQALYQSLREFFAVL